MTKTDRKFLTVAGIWWITIIGTALATVSSNHKLNDLIPFLFCLEIEVVIIGAWIINRIKRRKNGKTR